MGLDQYLEKVIVKEETEEVEYWRKNNQLQGWFEENCDQQNCIPTTLTIELVEKLLKDIDSGLNQTDGFFYGKSAMDEEQTQNLVKTFEAVLEDIKENNTTYQYNCWY